MIMKRPIKPAKPERGSKKTSTGNRVAAGPTKKQNPNASAPNTPAPSSQRTDSKLAIVIGMLRSTKGATIEALSKATGWQAHSVRGAMSGAIKKQRGLVVTSEKADGVRKYRISV
jgi:hypothetical protein